MFEQILVPAVQAQAVMGWLASCSKSQSWTSVCVYMGLVHTHVVCEGAHLWSTSFGICVRSTVSFLEAGVIFPIRRSFVKHVVNQQDYLGIPEIWGIDLASWGMGGKCIGWWWSLVLPLYIFQFDFKGLMAGGATFCQQQPPVEWEGWPNARHWINVTSYVDLGEHFEKLSTRY